MTLLEPPDKSRCQADKPGPGPFALGGDLGDPCNGYRVRCKATPTVIVTQTKPDADGLQGSMSLCSKCHAVLIEQMGADYTTEEKIR